MNTELDPGELVARYEVDAAEERGLARLRTVSAVLAIIGAVAVLLGRVPIAVFLAAALALLISVVWLGQARKARKRAREPERWFLAVHTRGLWLGEGAAPTYIPFAEVSAIEVDEERLDIVLTRPLSSPIRLEPRYPGVAIHELMATLRNAWQRGRDR